MAAINANDCRSPLPSTLHLILFTDSHADSDSNSDFSLLGFPAISGNCRVLKAIPLSEISLPVGHNFPPTHTHTHTYTHPVGRAVCGRGQLHGRRQALIARADGEHPRVYKR